MQFRTFAAFGLLATAAAQGDCPDLAGLWSEPRDGHGGQMYRVDKTDGAGCGFSLSAPHMDEVMLGTFSGSELSFEVAPGVHYTAELRDDGNLYWAHDPDAVWFPVDICDTSAPDLCNRWATLFPDCSEAGKWSDHCSNDNPSGDNEILLTAGCPHECAGGNHSACTSQGDDCCVSGAEEKSCIPGFEVEDLAGIPECEEKGIQGYTCKKGYFFMPCTSDDEFAPENVLDSHCTCHDCDAGRGDEDVCSRGECEGMGCRWERDDVDQCEDEDEDDFCHCEEDACRRNGFTWEDRHCGDTEVQQHWEHLWRPMGPKWGNNDPCMTSSPEEMAWAAGQCCHNAGDSSSAVCGGGSPDSRRRGSGCTQLSQSIVDMARSKGFEPRRCQREDDSEEGKRAGKFRYKVCDEGGANFYEGQMCKGCGNGYNCTDHIHSDDCERWSGPFPTGCQGPEAMGWMQGHSSVLISCSEGIHHPRLTSYSEAGCTGDVVSEDYKELCWDEGNGEDIHSSHGYFDCPVRRL